MKRKLFTPPLLEQRPPTRGRVEIRDSLSPLILRITSHGNRAFIIRARIKGQKQPIRLTYQTPPHPSVLEEARAWAVATIGACQRGQDPRALRSSAAASETATAEALERSRFGALAATFLTKHAAKNRSYAATKRILNFYVLPRWKDRPIADVSRADVVALLDEVEAGTFKGSDGKQHGGPVMADRVLACVRKLMNWHAARDDSYRSPIVKGMARTKPKERARHRKLTDDELRALWAALDRLDAQANEDRSDDETAEPSTFASFVRLLLLTGQRRDEVAQLARAEISDCAVWTIPADRYKAKHAHEVPLSATALGIIAGVSQIDDCDLVFTTNGETAFSGFSKSKRRLDKLMLRELSELATERNDKAASARLRDLVALFEKSESGDKKASAEFRKRWWTLHDLRRTAKTLMMRSGVRPDISERVLGHAIPGVEGIYDRHDYLDEKRAALEALESTIARLISPHTNNILTLPRAASA